MSTPPTITIDPDFASGARLGTDHDLALALALSVSWVRKMRARRALPAVKIGGAVRYHLPTVLKKLGVTC